MEKVNIDKETSRNSIEKSEVTITPPNIDDSHTYSMQNKISSLQVIEGFIIFNKETYHEIYDINILLLDEKNH